MKKTCDMLIEAALRLHTPEPRWVVRYNPEYSYDDYIYALGEVDDPAEITSFQVCTHCTSIDGLRDAYADDRQEYDDSVWPCPTARALGVTA